jgi:hypothetical protein
MLLDRRRSRGRLVGARLRAQHHGEKQATQDAGARHDRDR